MNKNVEEEKEIRNVKVGGKDWVVCSVYKIWVMFYKREEDGYFR